MKHAGWRLRVHLTVFALIMMAPAMLFSAILIQRFGALQRADAEHRVVQLAADLADDVDREHDRNILLLRSFSLSGSLRANDFKSFHAEASNTLAGTNADVIVLDRDLRPLLNTGVTWGAHLAPYAAPDAARQAITTRQPVVTGLIFGRTRQRQVINVLVPTDHDGEVDQVLVLAYGPERLVVLLEGQYIGGSWVTGVADRDDVVLARSREHFLSVGQQLPPPLRSRSHADKAAHVVDSLDGRPIIRATDRTRIAGWTVAASVDRGALDAAGRANWRDLMIWGLALLGLAGSACYVHGRSIERPLRLLVQQVTNPSRSLIPSSVREIGEVQSQLSDAVERMRASDEKFSTFAAEIDQVVWFHDLEPANVRYANPAYATIWGRSPDELSSDAHAWMSAVHTEDRGRVEKAYTDFMSGTLEHYDVEYRIVRPDGSERWIRDRGVGPRRRAGGRNRISGIADDITTAKQQARTLQRYRVLLDRARDIKLVLSDTGIILEANNAAMTAYGYSHAELIGLDIARLLAPEMLAEPPDPFEHARGNPAGALFETWHRRKDGSKFAVEVSSASAELDGQSLILSVVRDISARRLAEAMLGRYAASQENLLQVSTALLAQGHDGASLGGTAFEAVASALEADMCLTRWLEPRTGAFPLVYSAGLDRRALDKVRHDLEPKTGVIGAIGQAGDVPAVAAVEPLVRQSEHALTGAGCTAVLCYPMFDGEGQLVGSFAIGSTRRPSFTTAEVVHLHAVTNILSLAWARRAAERAVRQSEFQLRYAAQSAKLAYVVIDMTRKRIWNSGNFADVVGYGVPEAVPEGLSLRQMWRLFLDHVDAADRAKLHAVNADLLAGRDGLKLELRVHGDEGQVRWIETTWSNDSADSSTGSRHAFTTLLDITERKRNEERVRDLMREVNHRSKNLLGVVLSLARHTTHGDDIKTFVKTLSQRVAGLSASQDLLVRGEWHGVETGELVRAQLALVRDLIDDRVTIAGPRFMLTSTAAQAIGMALHELATNALTKGALATETGRIDVTWSLASEADTKMFRIVWREHVVAGVGGSELPSFRRLIMRQMVETAVRGVVSLNLDASGLSWLLETRAEHIVESGLAKPPRQH